MSYPYSYPNPNTAAPCPPRHPELAVVVVCHAAYLPLLPACLAAIDDQRVATQRVLVMDGCDYSAPAGWDVVRGTWGNPNPGRNQGWKVASQRGAEWCVFWDADNLMPHGYLHAVRKANDSAARHVGVLSPHVVRGTAGRVRFSVSQPEGRDFWDGRERSLSDTCSAWRIEALEQSGGFMDGNTMLDDYTLALAVTRLGWSVAPLDCHVWLADGETRSTHPGRGNVDLWNNASFHLVTLLAGRVDALRPWSEAIHRMELPPNTHITLVNDSRCPRFARDVQAEAESLLRRPEVRSVRVMEGLGGSAPSGWREIHRRVAALYNKALAGSVHEFTLLWEDDVIPGPQALRSMFAGFGPFSRQAAVGAVYPARCNPSVAVASLDAQRWARMPLLSWLRGRGRVEVGMLGGGFTLWANHYLVPALPLQTSPTLGWDGSLSAAVTAVGGRLVLDADTVAQHLVS